jgi:Tat protein secretion system quality control protein TatD with DNase activity
VNGSVPAESAVDVVVGLVPVDTLLLETDEHVCGLYAWHVELDAATAMLGSTKSSTPRTPTSAEMRFMNPFDRR